MLTLPNYFLADLPPEAALTPSLISEACRTLKHNRQEYLRGRSIHNQIELLAEVAARWLQPDYPLRQLVLEQSPAATGWPATTLATGLDQLFKDWTVNSFTTLIEQELEHHHRLDGVFSAGAGNKGRATMMTAPDLLVHFTSEGLPAPILRSMALGVLLRSAQFIRCPRDATLLPRLFAHSIYQADSKLGACLEIAAWKEESQELTTAAFDGASCVSATGSDEELAALRLRVPARIRFVAHALGVSFAYVASPALSGASLRMTAERAAVDVAAWNQLGSLAPHVIYVQLGGTVTVEQFAQLLAEELARLEQTAPRGDLPSQLERAIVSRREVYELRAAHLAGTRVWRSPNSTAWTVVYEEDPQFQLSCLNRFIYVKPIANLAAALHGAEAIRESVATIGLAAPEDKSQQLAAELGRWGASRVCPLGRMQAPSLLCRQAGRPALGDLVRRVEWEQ